MSLYSIDLLVNQDGKFIIAEMNGVNSGMGGFHQIYGGDRVEEKVFDLLKEKYGKLTWNYGQYAEIQFRKKHPLKFLFYETFRRIRGRYPYAPLPETLRLSSAFTEWMYLPTTYHSCSSPMGKLESYVGQDSTVFNIRNEKLLHPTINQLVAEQLTINKFLYYELLKNSELREFLPQTILIGCGWVDQEGITSLLERGDFFVRKPILGIQGKGVTVINKKELKRYKALEEPITIVHQEGFWTAFFRSLLYDQKGINYYSLFPPVAKYLEHYALAGDFSFEPGMIIAQPFVRSTMNVDGQELYSSVRSIVCNGQFIDAYARVSPDPVSNLSRSAIAKPFTHPDIKDFSEHVVQVYERECAKYNSDTFQLALYSPYFLEKSNRLALKSASSPIIDQLAKIAVQISDPKKE